MKKASTAVAKQSRSVSQPKLTIGLDLGDRSSCYACSPKWAKFCRNRKLGTTPKAMRQEFGAMLRGRIALETGTHSPWISRLLTNAGTPSHRGACPQGAFDRGEAEEKRSHGPGRWGWHGSILSCCVR